MRLSPQARQIIRNTSREVFGEAATVKLFGSRIDDSLKGGDIDLLIECPESVEEVGLKTARLAARLQRQLGDQKIDVLCIWPGSPLSPAHKDAIKTGIAL
ncbi:MAG: nucleotidyltransferase domain-containing protein [Pseudomonadota bacterium]